EIRALTHTGPLSLDITLWSVNMEAVRSLLASDPAADGNTRDDGAASAATGSTVDHETPLFTAAGGLGWIDKDDLARALGTAVRLTARGLMLKMGGLGLAGGIAGVLLVAGVRPARRWIVGGLIGITASL